MTSAQTVTLWRPAGPVEWELVPKAARWDFAHSVP